MTNQNFTTPDTDLQAEWREHHRARNVRRGPSEPQYDATRLRSQPQDDEFWTSRGYVKENGFWVRPQPITVSPGFAQAMAESKAKADKRRVYDLAREAIERKQDWYLGERIVIATANGAQVYIQFLRGTRLMLGIDNGAQGPTVKAGMLNLAVGDFFQFTLGEDAYAKWASEAQEFAGAA